MQNKPIPTVIGIDIGAYTTKVSIVDRGTVDILTNEANERETPSIVGYGDGVRKIGEIGNAKLKSNYKNTVISPNRYLGLQRNNALTQQQLSYCPCSSKFEDQKLLFKVSLNGNQQKLAPQQVLGSFMTQLTSIITLRNYQNKLIVFSIPSYFTQIQKISLINAGLICGLKNVQLINQTSAIGLDYRGFKKLQGIHGKFVVFIDFGYSKLMVSLIGFSQSKIQILYQKGNRNIGCRNIDKKIFQYIVKKFQQKKGLNIRQSKKASLKLLQAIQKQRKILSGIPQTDIFIQSLIQDQDLSQPYTRQIMYQQSKQIFDKIQQFCNKIKQQLIKLNIKYHSIELIGGGSRIPKFIQIIQQIFGINLSRTTNSSETISRGATLAAVQKSGLFKFNQFTICCKSYFHIQLLWRQATSNPNTTQYTNKQTIIDRNTNIPHEKLIKIQTQTPIEMLIQYNCQEDQAQRRIGRVLCEAPSSEKKQISCLFAINQDGIVKLVSVKDGDGNNVKFVGNSYKILSDEQIKAYRQKQKQMYNNDYMTVKLYEKKNDLQSYIYKQKQLFQTDELKNFGDEQQIKQLQQYLQKQYNQIQNNNKLKIEDYDVKKQQISKKINQMKKSIQNKKQEIIKYFKYLQLLKTHVLDKIKQIKQSYRNSQPVQLAISALKQISCWVNNVIETSKTKQIKQLPLVTKQEVDQKHQKIKSIFNQLIHPPKIKQQQVPKYQHFQQKYQPQVDNSNKNGRIFGDFMRNSMINSHQPSLFQRYKQEALQKKKDGYQKRKDPKKKIKQPQEDRQFEPFRTKKSLSGDSFGFPMNNFWRTGFN